MAMASAASLQRTSPSVNREILPKPSRLRSMSEVNNYAALKALVVNDYAGRLVDIVDVKMG